MPTASRRTTALAVSLLLLALGVTAAPPSNAAAPAAKPAVATATISLVGDKAGYVPLTVPRRMILPNPFSTQSRQAVTVSGGGRMSGFALVKDGLGAAVIGGRSAYTNEYADRQGVFVLSIGPEAQYEGQDFVLEAGSYKLYLITDGKPTTVRLRFQGGTGSSTLRPSVLTKEVVQVSGATPGTGPGVHTAGFDTPTGPSVHFSVAAFKTAAHAESVLTKCFFLRKPSGPNPYLPGCPSTGGDTGLQTVQPLSDENPNESTYYFTYYSLIPQSGHYASGVNYNSVSLLTESHYAHYFLDLGATVPKTTPATVVAPHKPPPAQPRAAAQPAGPMAQAGEALPATGPNTALGLAPVLLLGGAALRRVRARYTAASSSAVDPR